MVAPQALVAWTVFEQFSMRTLPDQRAAIHDDDVACVHHAVQSMGNHQHGTVLTQGIQ